jgi:hypothetical protein
MTEHPGGRGVAVKIDSFYQQVSRDKQIAIGYLSYDGGIIADSLNQARRVLSRSSLFAKPANEVKFVHEMNADNLTNQT